MLHSIYLFITYYTIIIIIIIVIIIIIIKKKLNTWCAKNYHTSISFS